MARLLIAFGGKHEIASDSTKPYRTEIRRVNFAYAVSGGLTTKVKKNL
jgi:hypothetical protein